MRDPCSFCSHVRDVLCAFYFNEPDTNQIEQTQPRSCTPNVTPPVIIRKPKSPRSQIDPNFSDGIETSTERETKSAEKTVPTVSPVDVTPEISKPIIHKNGRRKFHELRQCMQADEDENGPTNNSTPDSQGSSVEGVFPAPRTTHPFRIIEHDTVSMQSMTSLGRIGRILSGSADPSSASVGRDPTLLPASSSSIVSLCSKDSKDSESIHSNTKTIDNSTNEKYKTSNTSLPKTNISNPEIARIYETNVPQAEAEYNFKTNSEKRQLQEPDVIASTKTNKNKEESSPGPVAPPRRKKKPRTASLSTEDHDYEKANNDKINCLSVEASSLNDFITQGGSPLPSPASTIESLTRELEHSLDITNSNKKLATNPINEKSSHHSINTPSAGSNGNINVLNGINNSNNHNIITSNPIVFDKFRNGSGLSRSNTTMRSLDLWMATKGKYVVKPQDEDNSRAEGPSPEELERIERLKHEVLHCVRAPMTGHSGHSSLGPSLKYYSPQNSKERRKSAGDEDLLKQLNMYVRTRTDSGKELTDMEILEQVTVLNLDTGERVPLSVAEDKLPQCINPLSLHIMRLTSEYVSTNSLNKQGESDEESMTGPVQGLGLGEGEAESEEASKLRRGTARLKRFLGSTVKKTMDKAKSIAHSRHRDDVNDIDELSSPGEPSLKFKNSASHKGPYEFDSIQRVQELSGQHVGPVWCMKFSTCGRLLATAGQDRLLRVWVLRDAYTFFQDMRTKYNADQKVSPTPSQESLVSQHSAEELSNMDGTGPFMPRPFCTYSGHTSDLLDVSWSKNYFVLSSSMDKTVRLWHISRKECLCCFQHIDFVTAIVFHPRDDRYFLSGSLDGKLRLWNIPDKKVAVWNEVDGQTKLITAANFCQNGQFAVVGSYDGRCIFYTTDQLKYHTQIHVRSTRGKNATGRKISGIEPMPGEDNMHKILVTSNDSRIRLYDLHELNLSCKYKGYMNVSSQIKASFSHDGKYIVSGSENQCIYIWKTHHDYSKFSSVRRDRNDFWEGIKAHNAVVTCAVFAPHPDSIIKLVEEREGPPANSGSQTYLSEATKVEDPVVEQRTRGCGGHVLVSADFNGCIKVFINKTKPKHSSLPASALA